MTDASSAAPRPQGYTPLARPALSTRPNPDSAIAHAEALRRVLLYLIVDSFDLHDEEVVWVGHALDDVSGLVADLPVRQVPLAVRQEMLNGTYSRLFDLRASARSAARGHQPTGADTAPLDVWVDTLAGSVAASYDLPALVEARIRTIMDNILQQLGVGAVDQPRVASHLPTELRFRLNR